MTTASNDAFIRHNILGKEFDTYTPTQKKMARNVFKEASKYFDYLKKGKARDFIAKGPNIGEDNPYKGKTFTVEQMANLIREALPLYHSPDTIAEGLKSRQVDPLLRSGKILETQEGIDEEKTFDFFGLPKGLKPVDIREGGRGLPSLEERLENRYRPLDDVGGEVTSFFPDSRKLAEGGRASMSNDNSTNITNPFTQVYGQRRSSPLSMDEYLYGSMYDFPGLNTGIDVSAAPDLNQDEKDKDQAAPPNILTPVSERTNDPSSVFRAISQGGQLGTGYRVSAKDPSKYLDDLINAETFTVKEDGFSKYAQQKFKEGGGIPTTVAGLAMGNPALTILGAGAASLAQKQNKKNAQAMLQTGGGDLFELNGATVSRAPGERIFTGNLGGFSQEQLYAAREMDFGFIPGSMRETIPIRTKELTGAGPTGIPGARGMTTRTGNRGVAAAGQVSGHIMDAYGTIHGTRDESGVMQVGAIAAQRMRENEFRENMIAAGLQSKLDEMIADRTFTMNAVRAKQHTDGIMKAGQGFRFRAANVPADQYARALNDRGRTYQDYVKSTHGTTSTTKVDTSQPDDFVPSVTESKSEANRIRQESDGGGGSSAGTSYSLSDIGSDQGNVSAPSDFDSFSSTGFEGYDDEFYSRGGRVGMAAGDTPQATFEPGFVKGPPENFTERETVADDQNGKVKPDTFIINAAAVEIAGSEDIRKMLMKAYEVAVQKGLDIGRVDRKLYEGTVDVALSKGEVVVPPELAKIIGYDRLRKINNRGKKEVASRQKKAAKGGFISK